MYQPIILENVKMLDDTREVIKVFKSFEFFLSKMEVKKLVNFARFYNVLLNMYEVHRSHFRSLIMWRRG